MHQPAQPALTAELRAFPRAFWVLFAGTFVNRFGTFVLPFLTLFLTRAGYSLGDVAFAVSAHGAGSLVASIFGGYFADRIGRRNTIIIGTFTNAAFVFALYFAHGLPAIVALAACAGFTGGFYHPASSALVADLIPPEGRVRAYSALRLAGNAGFAGASAAGGCLVAVSFFWLFAGDAITTACYGVLAWAALPHGLRGTSQESRWSDALTHIRRDRRFWVLFTGTFCTALVFSQFGTSYSLQIIGSGTALTVGAHRFTPEQTFGMLIGWNGLLIVCGELQLTRLTQRFHPQRAMAIGYVLLGGGFALNAFAHSFGAYFLGMTIFTLGEMLSLPVTSSAIARIAPENMRGRYIGALGMAWSGAAVIGPQIGLRLYGLHPTMLWLGCGALGLIAAAVLLRFGDR